MNYYKLCKLYIKWYNSVDFPYTFKDYCNHNDINTEEFYNFMENKYGTWSTKKCQQYINECNIKYFRKKINEI